MEDRKLEHVLQLRCWEAGRRGEGGSDLVLWWSHNDQWSHMVALWHQPLIWRHWLALHTNLPIKQLLLVIFILEQRASRFLNTFYYLLVIQSWTLKWSVENNVVMFCLDKKSAPPQVRSEWGGSCTIKNVDQEWAVVSRDQEWAVSVESKCQKNRK